MPSKWEQYIRFDGPYQGLHFIIYKIKGLEFRPFQWTNFRNPQVWWKNGAEEGLMDCPHFAEDYNGVLEVK